MAAAQGDGAAQAELAAVPPLPDGAKDLWTWWRELHAARTSNGFGPNPISFTEIAMWAELTWRNPYPWEVQALKALDLLYIESLHGRTSRPDRDQRR